MSLLYFQGERINQQIYEFVRGSLSKGYDIYSIRNNLLRQYPQSEVDEVINIFLKEQQLFQLKNYVNTQLSLGFKPELIRNTLLQHGYNKDLVDSVFGNRVTVRHEIHFPLVTVLVILFLVVAGGVGYWLIAPKSGALLDVSIESYNTQYYAGEEIVYGIELINMGDSDRFDANVKYIILDSSKKSVKTMTETIAVETRTAKNGEILLPSALEPGKYYLRAEITYGINQKAESEVEFEIIEGAVSGQNQNTQGSNGNTGQGAYNTNQNSIPSLTNRNIQTFGESMNVIRGQAASNPSQAAANCQKFQNQEQKDICLNDIAYIASKQNYCDEIQDSNIKDNCYLAFIIGNDPSSCEKVANAQIKQYCNQVRIVKQMNEYYKSGNNEKLVELSKQFEPAIYSATPQINNYQTQYNNPAVIEDFIITAELNGTG
ncbi:MAG: hypothetical protein ACP5NV_06720 [Candidatus Woesearchaeota archaeon]